MDQQKKTRLPVVRKYIRHKDEDEIERFKMYVLASDARIELGLLHSGFIQANRTLSHHVPASQVRSGFRRSRTRRVSQLTICRALERLLLNYPFFSNGSPFEIGKTDRYTIITGKNELAVYSLDFIAAGRPLVPYIRGSLAPLTSEGADLLAGPDSNLLTDEDEADENEAEDDEVSTRKKDDRGSASGSCDQVADSHSQEDHPKAERRSDKGKGRQLSVSMGAGDGTEPKQRRVKPVGRAMRDFSVVYSTSRKRNELFLGPARFLNVSRRLCS